VASPRLTNESIFTLRRFAETAGSADYAVAEAFDLAPIFDNLSVPLCTHEELRYARTILLIGGEPEEEQTFTAKQVRQAVRNSGAKFIVVNDTPINLVKNATQFVHVNKGSIDAFALVAVDPSYDDLVARKTGIDRREIEALGNTIAETKGDVVILLGGNLSAEAQSIIAANAASLAGEGRRVLLHPLAKYNNSVGAHDMMPARKTVEEVVQNSKALLIGGSLQDASVLQGKE